MPPSLITLPVDILEHIAFRLALTPLHGPPTHLVPLLCTCSRLHTLLSFTHNIHLYSRIFRAKFDYRAPARRFGQQSVYSLALANQLVLYCRALKNIRSGDVYSPSLIDDFYRAFTLCSENDGRNAQQLRWANLPAFIERYLFHRLWDGREPHYNWPVEDGERAFALWLFWYTLTPETLASYSVEQRAYLQYLIRPYAIYNFRYPPFLAPDIHFHLPLVGNPDLYREHSVLTPHGSYPQYREPTYLEHTFRHFGNMITIAEPPIGLVAKLLYIALVENQPQDYPSPELIPADRAEALETGTSGPTLADYLDFGALRAARPPDHGDWDWRARLTDEEGRREDSLSWSHLSKSLSARHENDWERWFGCSNPWDDNSEVRGVTYTFGSLSGSWGGRYVDPFVEDYLFAITSTVFEPALERPQFTEASNPLYFTLREHHCISPARPLPLWEIGTDPLDEGVMNAYFPRDFPDAFAVGVHKEGRGENAREKLHIRKRSRPEEYVYETYVEGKENSHDEDTCEFCVERKRQEAEERLGDLAGGMDDDDDELYVTQTKQLVQHALGDAMDVDSLLDRLQQDDEDSDDSSSEYSVPRTQSRMSTSSGSSGSTEIERVCSGIRDIIITGETPSQQALAWRDFRIYGRVRAWDGLVVLVRAPVSAHSAHTSAPARDTYVFRGYLVGGRTLVGAWRHVTDSVHSIPVEGTFVVSKLEAPRASDGARTDKDTVGTGKTGDSERTVHVEVAEVA